MKCSQETRAAVLTIKSAKSAGEPMANVYARPVREVTGASDWDVAVRQRDHIREVIDNVLASEATNAAVIVSEEGNYPPWVRLEVWLVGSSSTSSNVRVSEPRQRNLLEFVVGVAPYCQFPVVLTTRLMKGSRRMAMLERGDFQDEDVGSWIRCALERDLAPRNYHPLRDSVVRFFVRLMPFGRSPLINRIERRYRPTPLTIEVLLAFLAVAIFMAGSQVLHTESAAGFALILLAVVIAIAVVVIVRRRPDVIVVPPQPLAAPPRRLGVVDSWHAVVSGLSESAVELDTCVANALAASTGNSNSGLLVAAEHSSYRTNNGYEERSRLVVRKNQAAIWIDIHAVGEDLYAGWHGYLNWAQWIETVPISTRIRDGVATQFRALAPGLYLPSQLDLVDLNCISDLVHRSLRSELQRLVKEHAIDESIDFEINRGDRKRAVDRSRHAGELAEANAKDNTWTQLMHNMASWHSAGSSAPIVAALQESEPSSPSWTFAAFSAFGLAALQGVATYLIVANSFGALGAVRVFSDYLIMPVWLLASATVLGLGTLLFGRVSVGGAILVGTAYVALGQIFGLAVHFAHQQFRDLTGGGTASSVSMSVAGLFLSVVAMVIAVRLALPSLSFGWKRVLAAALVSGIRSIPYYLLVVPSFAPDVITRAQYALLSSGGGLLTFALVGFWIGLARSPRRS